MKKYINRITIYFVFTILIFSSIAQAGIQEELKKQYYDKIRELNDLLSRYLHQLGIETNKLQQDELKKQYENRLRDYFNGFGDGYYYKNWVSIGDIEKVKGRLYDSDIRIDIDDPKYLEKNGAKAMYVGWDPFYNPFKGNTFVLVDVPNRVDPIVLWHEMIHAITFKNEENEEFLAYNKNHETYAWYMQETVGYTNNLKSLESSLKDCTKSSEFFDSADIIKKWRIYENGIKNVRSKNHMDDVRIDQLKRWTGFDIDLKKIKEKYENGEATNGVPVNLDTGECGTQSKKNNQNNDQSNDNLFCPPGYDIWGLEYFYACVKNDDPYWNDKNYHYRATNKGEIIDWRGDCPVWERHPYIGEHYDDKRCIPFSIRPDRRAWNETGTYFPS